MTNKTPHLGLLARSNGFSLVEILVVIAVMGIMVTIATPVFTQWSRSIDSSRGARGAYDMLREARSKASTTNSQHMVAFDQPNRRYRMLKGTRAYNTPSSEMNTVVQNWVTTGDEVTMTGGATVTSTDTVNVRFNANGTADLETPAGTAVVPPATVFIGMQGGSGKMNAVVVSTSGRISLQ